MEVPLYPVEGESPVVGAPPAGGPWASEGESPGEDPGEGESPAGGSWSQGAVVQRCSVGVHEAWASWLLEGGWAFVEEASCREEASCLAGEQEEEAEDSQETQ